MEDFTTLSQEINQIKERNSRVEQDKAWETSAFRRTTILFLTYCVISIFFITIHLPKAFINALVPTLGYLLSTLSVPLFKKLWLKYFYKK